MTLNFSLRASTRPILRLGRCHFHSLTNPLLQSHAVALNRIASHVFDETPHRGLQEYNQLLFDYSRNDRTKEALNLFESLRRSGLSPDEYTMSCILKVCAGSFDDGFVGRQVHCQCVKSGLLRHVYVGNSLVGMYVKTGAVRDGGRIFDEMRDRTVVSWTAMISGYMKNGDTDEAVNLFIHMRREGVKPNQFTYSSILAVQNAVFVSEIHAEVIKINYEKSSSAATALLDAYVKIGNVSDAVKVFELIEEKDIIVWSAMLAGYAQQGETEEAAKIFRQLIKEGIKPNEVTLYSIIRACGAPTAAIEQGKQFHAYAIKLRLNNTLYVSNALVNMYAKRGNIDSAYEIFKRQKERDLVSWNSMISGYAKHGQAKKALEVFEEMQKLNVEVDPITFIAVISACTHAGLVDQGQHYFNVMINDHHISPTMVHYSCLVDLYSRAGMLEKAMDIINEMPFPPGETVWSPILAASRVHRNVELGKLAAEKLISLQPQRSAPYVVLSNMYVESGHLQEGAKVRKMKGQREARKEEPGCSWIEVKKMTFAFIAGDYSHPFSDHIYSKLSELNIRLSDAGYQPDTNYATNLSEHSERLAMALGLMCTPPEIPLHIEKNLRVCEDCHNFIKLASQIEQRYIIIRDSNRFHHFKDGICSCGDYW